MAARHLRRLQEQLQTSAAPAQHSGSETEEDDEPVTGTKPFNPFDLLSDNEVSCLIACNYSRRVRENCADRTSQRACVECRQRLRRPQMTQTLKRSNLSRLWW